ncbi:hypothetical protein Y032_0032g2493 [Ancylostoma ceylanicum]|uniref:Uncharacterized protein n=1 Tax=Ancylostoma ceylanicum TaxID=53326 RepID=A0A016UQL0_9BILA|nr:hypothetical protein Y032_0032g2493 [Ancylostoma ceylanicum]
MAVLLFCLVLLCISNYGICSNYTIFYKRNPSQLSYVTVRVSSRSKLHADELSFGIRYIGSFRPTVFVDGQICNKKCAADLLEGDSSTLTFANDSVNLISFYQYYSTTTYLYYRQCYQPMDYLKCRYRIENDFELCICNNHVLQCTYDALLSWDEIWCTNQTLPTITTEQATTKISYGSVQPTGTPQPHGPPVEIGSFSIFYKNEKHDDWTDVAVAVNISVNYQAANEKSVTFDVRNNGTRGYEFLVDGKECKNHCNRQMQSSYQMKLDVFNDIVNTVTMIGSAHNETMFNYLRCLQPLNGVICRARTGLPWCICNGPRNNCTADAQLAIGEKCTLPDTTLFTTPVTLTTSGFESLKNLSEGGVDLKNVSRVLNETLVYSEQRSGLGSDEIQQITTILQKSANLSGIQAEDSQKILLNMDCILSANASQIQASGNSSQILLGLLPTLVQNTNATALDFLDGENLGFTSRAIDCSSIDAQGLIDLGKDFKTIDQETSEEDPHNSIFISVDDICKDSEQASHMFMTIYRNRKFFIGLKQYTTYGTTTTLAQRSRLRATTIEEDEAQTTKQEPPPSPCLRQIALPDESPVMSGTVLSNDETISRLSTQKTMATLKFNITDLLQPLHGHFRVTWWDPELLEWSTEDQCQTSIEGNTIVATCEHLTDFSLIVDAALNDPNVCDRALIGLGISTNTLSILSLTFLAFINLCGYWPTAIGSRILRYLRGYAPPQRDFVSLCHKVSLLLFYILFTGFSDQKVSGKACDVFAALSYILLMSSILLTIFQALRLTTVFSTVGPYLKLLILPSSAVTISFLIPFVTSVLLLTLTNFFHRGDCFCWVRPNYIVYAVIIPTSFLLLNGIICTIIVCKRLFGVSALSKAVRHRDRLISKVVAILIMQISLGMPWILQYPMLFVPSTTAWHYIFTIIMGSQGTLLMMLFFYKRRQAVASYRRSHISRSGNTREEFSTNPR